MVVDPPPEFPVENYRKEFGRKARAAAKADAWRHALALKKLVEMRIFPPGTQVVAYTHNYYRRPALCVRMPVLKAAWEPWELGSLNEFPALDSLAKPSRAEKLRRQALRKLANVARYFRGTPHPVDYDATLALNWGLHSDGNAYLFDLHGIPYLPPGWKSPDGKIPALAEAMRRFEGLKPTRGKRA